MLIRFSRLSALLLCIIPALPPVFGAPAAPRPNFVVILCDDLVSPPIHWTQDKVN